MKKVLVIGASRGVGLAVVRRALAAGLTVRAFARGAGRIPIEHAGLERCTGDARSPDDVARALVGVDAVVQSLGVDPNPRFIVGPVDIFSTSTRVLVPAMRAAGVRRLVSVTGFGAGETRAAIPLLQRVPFMATFGRAYADKDLQEQLIVESGLDWTLVRPGVLTNGKASGRYRVLEAPATWRNGIVSRADVAEFIVGELEAAEHVGKGVVIVR